MSLDSRPSPVILIDEADLDPHRIKTALGAGSVVVITPSLVAGNGWTFPETSTRRDGMGKLRVSKLRVNPHAHLASWDGRTLDVTEQEFQVLLLLARHPGRALSFEDISQEALHTPTYGHTEALRSAVKRLRRKLVGAGVTMRIEAVRGYGFRLDPGRARLRSEPTDRTA